MAMREITEQIADITEVIAECMSVILILFTKISVFRMDCVIKIFVTNKFYLL